jgi:hypothetical protein
VSTPRSTYKSELQEAAATGADWINDTIFQGITSEGLDSAGLDIMLHADNLGSFAILERQRQAPESQETCHDKTTQHHSTGSEYCGTENMLELILQTPSRDSVVEEAVSESQLTNPPAPNQQIFTTMIFSQRQSQSSIASSCIETLSKLAVDLHGHHSRWVNSYFSMSPGSDLEVFC